jgi:hypothetical protein
METDPSLEFEHFLAQKLSRTVDELRHGMSNVEFVGWAVYYGRKAQREELELAKVKRR